MRIGFPVRLRVNRSPAFAIALLVCSWPAQAARFKPYRAGETVMPWKTPAPVEWKSEDLMGGAALAAAWWKQASDGKRRDPPQPAPGSPRGGVFLLDEATLERLAKEAKPLRVLFDVGYGTTGSVGEPVLEPDSDEFKRFRGEPVLVRREVLDALVGAGLPHENRIRRIRIEADVLLKYGRARNHSIPGAPFQTYWEIRIKSATKIWGMVPLPLGENPDDGP